MKFLKSYDKYNQAFKEHHSEHMIAKHDKIDSLQSMRMTIFCFFSIIISLYFSYQTVVYFDWSGLAGIPIFFLCSFAMIAGACFVDDKLFNSDSKMNILCDALKDNIHDNEKAILAFYLEVRNFLSLHRKQDIDKDIIIKIDEVIKAYALNDVQPQHIKKIMKIHNYVQDEDVFKRFISLSDETLNKIEQYKATLLEKEPSIEKKPQYAEMM